MLCQCMSQVRVFQSIEIEILQLDNLRIAIDFVFPFCFQDSKIYFVCYEVNGLSSASVLIKYKKMDVDRMHSI